MSLNFLATRFTCSWPWSTLVLLCDGRIVCGCADPYAKRVLGDVRQESVSQIWRGERARSLRTDLNAGGSKFCGDCPLKLPLKKDDDAPQRALDVAPLPSRLYIECTAACNISCAQACCAQKRMRPYRAKPSGAGAYVSEAKQGWPPCRGRTEPRHWRAGGPLAVIGGTRGVRPAAAASRGRSHA